MRILSLVAIMTLMSFSCGGCASEEDPGDGRNNATVSESEFIEPPPSQAELQARVETLLAEFEPQIPAATRESVDAYIAPFESPSALEDPVDAVDAYLALGEAAFFMGSSSGATWAFLEAVALDLDNPIALSQLGFILTYEERYPDARPFLLHAQTVVDDLHTILVSLAYNYAAIGELERCVYYLEEAVALQPENGHIHHELAKCYFRAGQPSAGEHALEVAQRLAPFDSEIRATLDAPPDAEMPGDEPTDPYDVSGGSEDTAGSLIEAFNTCFMQYTTDFAERAAPYSGFGGQFDELEGQLDEAVVQHNYDRSQCEIECGESDACEAACLQTQCMKDTASFGLFRGEIIGARINWASGHGIATSGFAGCAWSEYFELRPQVAKFEAQTVSQMIWAQLEAAHENRVVTWDDVDERIALWGADIRATCDDAAQAIADIDWENPGYFDPFRDLDVKICSPLSDSFCLKMTNTTVTVTTPISITSPVNLELSFDARTGKFNATVTVPLKSKSAPGDVVSGAANLKLDLQKGVGVQAEGKIAGPLEKTWTAERTLFTPRW